MGVFDGVLVDVGDGEAVFVGERVAVGRGVSINVDSNVKVSVGGKDVDISVGAAVAGGVQADINTPRNQIVVNALFDSIKNLSLFMAIFMVSVCSHFVQ